MSTISSASSSLPGTCRYSDIVATPRLAATRRIDTAALPSVSAIPMAARTIRSRVSSGSCRPAGFRSPRTTVPEPCAVVTSPWSRSAAITFVAVAIATPHSRVIALVDGARSPGASLPSAIRSAISAAIRR